MILVICSLKLSLLSRVTPRNFADLDSINSGVTHHQRSKCPFQVNMTICVLSVLMDRSLVWHHFSIVLMVLRVLSQMISKSFPSAREIRSSAKAYR